MSRIGGTFPYCFSPWGPINPCINLPSSIASLSENAEHSRCLFPKLPQRELYTWFLHLLTSQSLLVQLQSFSPAIQWDLFSFCAFSTMPAPYMYRLAFILYMTFAHDSVMADHLCYDDLLIIIFFKKDF